MSWRTDGAEVVAAVFEDGDPAVYTPAGEGEGVTLNVIPDVQDVESLADIFPGARTRQVQRLVAVRAADVTARPAAGARIVIDGVADFTVTEEAMSADRFQLVWLCAVRETPPPSPPPPGP
jgi:hypothetical protein